MKHIPNEVSSRALKPLAADNETLCVRVIFRNVNNSGVYRHKCRNRTYLFERNGRLNAHVLDIPVSLYMQGVPDGSYRDNTSISHDLQPTAHNGIITQVIPFGDGAANASEDTPKTGVDSAAATNLALLGKLLTKLSAPEIMHEGLKLAQEGTPEELTAFIDSIELVESSDEQETEKTEETPEPETEPETETPPPFTLKDGEILDPSGKKIAGFHDPDNHLRMSRGNANRRDEVEAFLESLKGKSAEAESVV